MNEQKERHNDKAFSGYEAAKEMLTKQKTSVTLICARQTIETLVKETCTRFGIAIYDSEGKDVMLITLIDAMNENNIISDAEQLILHRIRMLGNKGAHISCGEPGPTMEEAEETVELLKQAMDLLVGTRG